MARTPGGKNPPRRDRQEQERADRYAAQVAERAQDRANDMTKLLQLLGFSEAAANALVTEQLITDQDALLELDDDQVENLCKTVRKPGGGDGGHQIPEMAVARLQLLVFYVKHLDRSDRFRFTDLAHVDLAKLNKFKDQKKLEKDWLKQNPEHKLEAMQLDTQTAAASFDQAVTILRRIRGVTGVPLSYVVRHRLYPAHSAEDPPCGNADSAYTTHDEELEARAPILTTLDYYNVRTNDEYEKAGPFHPAFQSDTKKAWSVLHSLWSTTGAWTHVKTMDKTQNGRQVYRTLHKHFFGGNKISTMSTGILSRLRNLTYTGDTKNFNFDKYVTNHVQQHNLAASLVEYGGQAIDERYKIEFFLTGIQCPDFDVTKANVAANTDRFSDFDSVKDHFVEFRRMQHASKPPGTSRNVSSVAGRGGGGRGRGTGRGRGDRDGRDRNKDGSAEARRAGLPSQAEVDKCTHIKDKWYSKDEYKKLTPAEKQRLWQLQNANQKPGTDSGKRKVAAINTNTPKDDSDDNASLFGDDDQDKKKGSGNRDNAALARKKQK